MPTLVLSQRYTNDSNALFRAALAAGWDVERLRGFACPEGLAGRDPVLYGETLLADAIMDTLGLALLEPTDDWLPSLPLAYRRRAVRLSTYGEARTIAERSFIKSANEKWFPARVYARGDEIPAGSELDPAASVLIAEPVRFEVEFRFFVLDRSIAASSVYIRGGEIAEQGGEWPASPEELAGAAELLEAMLRDESVALPPAVVVDVGNIEGRGFAVVEANAAWASGLCGADPRAVLAVLRRASVPRAALREDERRWTRATQPMHDEGHT